jgi:SAM-dependent methyltransferase
MMITQSREDVCRKIVRNKLLLALPLGQVLEIDTYLKEEWGIKLPSDPEKFEKELLKAAGGKLRKDYNTLNDKQADYLISGEPIPPSLEQKFYDLIADEKIAGLIHSKKRTFILDAAALIISLIKNLHVSGPILDIGCSIGYHCGVVGKFAGLEIIGIDSSKKTISEAKRKNKNIAGTMFKATTIENEEFSEKFDLVYAIDSIEIDKANLRLISRTLKPNGIALLINDLEVFTSPEFKKALAMEDLGFGFADVTGGWIGEETGFEAKTVLVLIKGGTHPLPIDLKQQAESYWNNHFKDYANDKTNREDQKTQAYCRAKLANLLDLQLADPTNGPTTPISNL